MSEMMDLSEVVNDGVLSEDYSILRSTGVFQLGGWATTSTTISGYGVVSVASSEDLEMVPEGDQLSGAMVFHSQEQIFITEFDESAGGVQRVSDIILWNSQKYRVLNCWPYPNRNFWKAIAVRMPGY